MGRLKSALPIAQAVHRLVRLGGMPEPRWLAAAERLGLHVREPAPKQRPRVRRPPRIEFPEDRVITSILARRPDIKSLPVDHGAPSMSSSAVREVALRAAEQLRHVPSWDRRTKKAILSAAADEAAEAAKTAVRGGASGTGDVALPSPPTGSSNAVSGGGLVEAMQRAEEAVLMAALARKRAAARRGGGGAGATTTTRSFASSAVAGKR